MRTRFCRKNHKRGVGVLGKGPQDGLQRAGETWWEARGHSHVAETVRMSHPEGGTSCPLHPVVVSRVSMCRRVRPQLAGSSGDQEVRGQVTVAATRRVDPGELHAILVFPDDHFSVSVQVMKTDLVLRHPLPLLRLPTQRIHGTRHPFHAGKHPALSAVSRRAVWGAMGGPGHRDRDAHRRLSYLPLSRFPGLLPTSVASLSLVSGAPARRQRLFGRVLLGGVAFSSSSVPLL